MSKIYSSKICLNCNNTYFKKSNCQKEKWEKSKYCSVSCYKDTSIDNYKKKLLSLIKVDKNGCWLYQGLIEFSGYGVLTFKGKSHKAHRLSYKIFIGEIKSNLFVCHKCDVRACINPDHLFLGTHEDNMQDMVNKNRKFKPIVCAKGHEYTIENTLIQKGRWKKCRECSRLECKERRDKNRIKPCGKYIRSGKYAKN